MTNKQRLGIILSLIVLSSFLFAEEKTTMVYLEHSETLSFDEQRLPDAQILIGNVIFRHDSALMYCDSAYYYEKNNSLDAFGHVRLEQGDTLQGFGDVLYYDGNAKIARFRNNVKLIHTHTTLTTDSLNYNRPKDIAYYFTGGTIRDSVNTLTSVWGQYTLGNHQALFKKKVHLVNDKFVLDADSLKYNTETNIADLVGKTDIVYEKETFITSTRGWYDTRTEESMLTENAYIKHEDGKHLTGDTIFYDKPNGRGFVKHNMNFCDSVNQATLRGHFGWFEEKTELGFATDSALFIDHSSKDSMYLHADSLYMESVPYRTYTLQPKDSVLINDVLTYQKPDTLWKDTSYRHVRAYHHVRVYRQDMQAICDSMRYNGKDSIISLYVNPVIWKEDQQFSADSIMIFIKNESVEHIHGIGSAIAAQQDRETQFNQLSGKEILAYIKDGQMREIHVNGNAETVFFAREDDGTLVGVNKTQSSYVKLYIEDGKLDHMLFTATTTGAMHPIDKIAEKDTKLSAFFWADTERPTSYLDVFRDPENKVERPQKTALSAVDTAPTTEDTVADTSTNKSSGKGNKKLSVKK